ncbi:3,4-dihydroxy-2-butanone-4-phosphate synthase [Streptomyces sp. NPDC047197]|uniref:3,4-dihydroxy-2-butanone-4-phosphate synthase n=1 Tax=Streptomyces sp. NPDC047197 TaxID=3155477 RepID=UPI00340F7588
MNDTVVCAPIEAALEEIAAGRPVIVADNPRRENEGDLIFAAQAAQPELLAFAMRYSTGVICAPLPGDLCERLNLPPMWAQNEDRNQTAFTVSVDARDGITTGVSAEDRAHTLRLLADPGATAGQLTRPGHVFPLRARAHGVLERAGHTEAATDLVRLAGLPPVGVIAELVNDDGTMQRMPQLADFARTHGLLLITIDDLIAHRQSQTPAPMAAKQ